MYINEMPQMVTTTRSQSAKLSQGKTNGKLNENEMQG